MDHGPFLAAGVPGFTLWVDEGEYDTANAPDAPGRRLSTTAATQLLEKLGLESLRRAVYEPGDPK